MLHSIYSIILELFICSCRNGIMPNCQPSIQLQRFIKLNVPIRSDRPKYIPWLGGGAGKRPFPAPPPSQGKGRGNEVGPYEVLERTTEVNYRIKRPQDLASRCKLYILRTSSYINVGTRRWMSIGGIKWQSGQPGDE